MPKNFSMLASNPVSSFISRISAMQILENQYAPWQVINND
jgi:hypothetical protein